VAISLNWGSKIVFVPRNDMTLIQSVPTEIRELDLNAFRLTLKDLEDDEEGMSFIKTHNHNTEVTVGGVTLARVIEMINSYTVTFEDGQYAVNLKGANSNVGDVTNVNQVSIRSANSAGLVTSQAIEFGEYGGAVTIDILKGVAGTIYPIGTRRRPSNNVTDSVSIALYYGFSDINILTNMVLDTGDDVRGYHMVGVSHVNTTMLVNPDCLCLKTSFDSFDITGTLDGDSEITNCVVHDITYFNGHIHDSSLNGVITLAGSLDATITDCYQQQITSVPIIDCGSSGQNLVMPNYSGRLQISNLTGPSELGIGLDAAEVEIDSSCTDGIIMLSGVGRVVDNSGPGCYVVNTVVSGSEVTNLTRLVELLRPHHTGTGIIWFWDPYGGDDTNAGDHAHRATKTFARAHELVNDNNHDIIVCVSGDPTGVTFTNEQILITKNYVFVRGPGRDFHMHCNDDNLAAVDMQGDGCEISGMLLTTESTNTIATIKCSASFPLIENIYIEDSGNGILIVDGAYGIIKNTRVGHSTGYGVRINGGSQHFTLDHNHIGSCTEDGVVIDVTTGHEVTFKNGNVIHNNGGYGINITANSTGVQIGASNSIANNALGNVNDLGGGTSHEKQDIAILNADTLLTTDLTPYDDVNTLGGVAAHLKHLEFKLYIDSELIDPEVEDGSQHNPFSNETIAIDFAEFHNILNLRLMSEIEFTRQIKNFYIDSINISKITTNSQNLDGSRFTYITLDGLYSGSITVQESRLISTSVTNLNGNFENCGLASTFEVPDGGFALVKNCTAISTDFTKPTISIGGITGTAQLALMGYVGGITIINCNQPTDIVKIIAVGMVEIDSSCTNGQIIIFGNVKPIDNSGIGCSIQFFALNPEEVKDIHITQMNKRITNESVKTITTYEDDQTTIRKVFDYIENAEGEIIEIAPQ